jgi:hypothetical protein
MFRHLFKNGTNNKKRESTRKGEGRGGSWLYILEYTFYGAWSTPRLVAFKPTSKLALTPIREL